MGQYYSIANMDKKEYLYTHDYDCGLKLMEFSYKENKVIEQMLKLMNTDWKGDKVFIVGDYADQSDLNECWIKPYQEACKAFDILDKTKVVYENEYEYNLDDYINDNFTRIKPHIKGRTPRYVYNTNKQNYLDLNHANIAWAYKEEKNGKEYKGTTQFSDISLLLAMGNGRGGGDYHTEDCSELVGSWCEDSDALIVSTKKLDEFKDYEEFRPGFYEGDAPINYEERENLLKALDVKTDTDYNRSTFYIDSLQEMNNLLTK